MKRSGRCSIFPGIHLHCSTCFRHLEKEILINGNKLQSLIHCRMSFRRTNLRFAAALLLIACCSSAMPVLSAYGDGNDAPETTTAPTELSRQPLPETLDRFSLPADFTLTAQDDHQELNPVLLSATQTSADEDQPAEHKQRWSSFLPIWGEEAREKGYELPLPFGVAGSFFYGNRDIDVDSVDVDIRNTSLKVDSLADTKVYSTERNWSMRFDAWILPFLNLYILGGYTKQGSDVSFDLNLRNAPLLQFILPRHSSLRLDLDGTTFGGGTTLVGGYKQFYAAVDTNYTISDLKGDLTERSTFDQQVDALLFSTRVGWRTRVSTTKVNFWVGGTYWGIAQTVNGDVQLPIVGNIDFEVEESPAHPISAHIGTHIEFTQRVNFTCDVGSNFADMFSIVPALSYRF